MWNSSTLGKKVRAVVNLCQDSQVQAVCVTVGGASHRLETEKAYAHGVETQTNTR